MQTLVVAFREHCHHGAKRLGDRAARTHGGKEGLLLQRGPGPNCCPRERAGPRERFPGKFPTPPSPHLMFLHTARRHGAVDACWDQILVAQRRRTVMDPVQSENHSG